MTTLRYLVARNCKLFFKDKGVLLPSLLAPLILLFLFLAFLGNVYRDSIRSVVEEGGFSLSGGLVESIASGWLVSSLLAVCAVTIAFTANLIMVQDKVTGAVNDLYVSPLKRHILSLSYFISTYLVTACVCFIALGAGFVYMAIAGWHLSAGDVFLTIADVALLVLFGTGLSSVICRFLNSQGGIAAVQATVSSAYGFLCGAYMPLANMAAWLKGIVMCLPGTYGTGLLHEHLMGGAIEAIAREGVPEQFAAALKEGFDCSLDFFGSAVPEWTCYLVLAFFAAAFIALYVLLFLPHRRGRGGAER